MIPTLVYWDWWVRWVETRVATDEGTYADGQVPDDYGGPQLTIGVIQQVIVCTQSGHFQKYKFGNTSELKDKDRKLGLGIKIEAFPKDSTEDSILIPEETIAAAGPSAIIALWKVEENTLLTSQFRTAMAYAYGVALGNIER